MGDRIAQLRKWAAEQRKHHSQHTADFYEETADEIERLRTKRDTAFLEGVKAGLETVERKLPWSVWFDWGLHKIDPATVKPKQEK